MFVPLLPLLLLVVVFHCCILQDCAGYNEKVLFLQHLSLRKSTSLRPLPFSASVDGGEHASSSFQSLYSTLLQQGCSSDKVNILLGHTRKAGFQDEQELVSFSRDFIHRPEVLATIFQSDFGFTPLDAHKLRAAITHLLDRCDVKLELVNDNMASPNANPMKRSSDEDITVEGADAQRGLLYDSYHELLVNPRQKQRTKSSYKYGLPKTAAKIDHAVAENEVKSSSAAANEMNDFLSFMTDMSPLSQEAPIRHATAEVYVRHARLFLGWLLKVGGDDLSDRENDGLWNLLVRAFPSKERDGAEVAFRYVKWLREERQISASYEANMVRGLIKLAKFRFKDESLCEPGYGGKSYEDIPCIRELRKLHTQANRKSKLAPRVSDETKKWISWPEFLRVVHLHKQELEVELQQYREKYSSPLTQQGELKPKAKTKVGASSSPSRVNAAAKRRVAEKFQKYLLLALFATVPDRQRTMRELKIGTTLVREDGKEFDLVSMSKRDAGVRVSPLQSTLSKWIIKHGPDDYKTGKAYGDRPPLVISPELTSAMDEFVTQWRSSLILQEPDHLYLFSQIRTGTRLNSDAIYSMVSRSCYKYTGKKTNPHLLRDMIVTHVRGTDASEKELESLALYMGHSISMQRQSYDRRTLQQKVEPAVNLLQSISLSAATPKNSPP